MVIACDCIWLQCPVRFHKIAISFGFDNFLGLDLRMPYKQQAQGNRNDAKRFCWGCSIRSGTHVREWLPVRRVATKMERCPGGEWCKEAVCRQRVVQVVWCSIMFIYSCTIIYIWMCNRHNITCLGPCATEGRRSQLKVIWESWVVYSAAIECSCSFPCRLNVWRFWAGCTRSEPQYCSRCTASVMPFFLSRFCPCSFIWWSRCKDCPRGHCPSWLFTCFDHLATLWTRLQQLLLSPQRTGIERFAKDFKSNQIHGHRCHDSSSRRTVPRFAWKTKLSRFKRPWHSVTVQVSCGFLQLPSVTIRYPLNVPFSTWN